MKWDTLSIYSNINQFSPTLKPIRHYIFRNFNDKAVANRGVVVGNEPVGDVGADGGLVMLQDVHLDREGPGQAGHVPAPVPHLVVVALRLEDPPEGQTRISRLLNTYKFPT